MSKKPIDAAAAPERTAKEMLDEFQGYQGELEMMNETLRRVASSLEEARDRYQDIYEFAPVGYFTLDGTDLIAEANLTGAMLLGEDRQRRHRPGQSGLFPPDRLWCGKGGGQNSGAAQIRAP